MDELLRSCPRTLNEKQLLGLARLLMRVLGQSHPPSPKNCQQLKTSPQILLEIARSAASASSVAS